MNIAMLLDLPALLAGDRVALVEGDTELTYGELHGRAGAAARFLAERGLGAGDLAGYLGANHAEFVSALFGCASLGAGLAALNYRAGTADVRHVIEDSGASLLLVDTAAAPDAAAVARELGIRVLDLDALRQAQQAPQPLVVPDATEETDLAALIYTSGTTARAKGVPLSHGALSEYVLSRTDVADGGDAGRALVSVPLYHVAGISGLLVALYGGRTVVLEPRFAPAEWLMLAARHHITHAFLVPTMLAKLIEAPELATTDLSALRSVSYGAAPMPPALLRRIVAAFPASVGFSGAYGLSESLSTVAVLDEDDHRRFMTVPRDAGLINSVGRAVADVRFEILDESGEPLGPGQVGTVAIVSRRNVSGYWHDKEAATAVGESRLVTGDLGYLDRDGYLFLTGRASDLIIRGGENISPVEVENALLEDERIADAAVLGVPDETWGEVVGAYVVLRDPRATFTLDDAILACAGLARFKRPQRLSVVADLPRTATGKLLRRALPV